MARRMGDAIRQVFRQPLHHPERARPEGDEKAPLFNDIRRNALFLLYDQPGAHLRKLSKMLGTDVTTARWHLRVLVENGYIESGKRGKYAWYGPSGLGMDYGILSVIHVPGCKEVMASLDAPKKASRIAKDTGLGISNLYSKARTLEDAGLVRRKEGKIVPTTLRNEMAKRWASRIDDHVRALAEAFVRQGILVRLRSTRIRHTFYLDLGVERERRYIRRDAVGRLLDVKVAADPFLSGQKHG